MRKIAIYLIILIIGGGIGFFLNEHFDSNKKQNSEVIEESAKDDSLSIDKDKAFNEKNSGKNKPTVTEDNNSNYTDTEEAVSEISENSEEEYEETLLADDSNDADSNNDYQEEGEEDEEDEEEIIIMKEELLSQRVLNIEPLKTDTADASSVLELKSESFAKQVTVEFWKSPLNITGYELTRNKLKLFGFNPSETIGLQLSSTGEQLLLNTETMSIILHKTKNFQSLTFK